LLAVMVILNVLLQFAEVPLYKCYHCCWMKTLYVYIKHMR